MAAVVLEQIYKTFPHRDKTLTGISVLRQIDLTVNDGEFMVLVGPSGCGKSTLLRVIAGLEDLCAGKLYIGDRLANSLPPKARDVAMVFQNYALYPHLNVYENLAFGLRRMDEEGDSRGISQVLSRLAVALTRPLPKPLRYLPERERAIAARVQTVAEQLQIEQLLHRLPRELSGGQKQRVALGRAISRNPAVFLMDEPLSNLDAKLRSQTRGQLVELQRQLGTTTIYVTHDRLEAMTMGDRIAVMNQGQIQQVGAPLDLYHAPANRFVAEFLGSPPMNLLTVHLKDGRTLLGSQFRLTLSPDWEPILRAYDGQTLLLGIRPEHLTLGVPAPKNLRVQVRRIETLGSETYFCAVALDGEPITLQVRVSGDTPISPGDEQWLSINRDRLHLFDPQTERAIAKRVGTTIA